MRYLAFTLLLPFLALSQTETKVKSEIKDVTIFTVGAEVSRAAKVNLIKGVNELAFEKLSPSLDEKSIQFNAGGDITILSIKYDVRYDESTQARIDKAAELNRQLKDLGKLVSGKRDLLAISVNEEQVLMANTDFDVWEGMTVTQLQQGVDLVRNRLTEIKQRKQKIRTEIDDLNEQRQKVVNQLQAMRIEDAKPNGVVLVKLKSEAAKTVDAEISYVVADAGWEPYYDLRVENVSKPLKIEYKAKVHQNTGEEWKNVNLTLSTGNPYEEGRLPQLDPWFLNFISAGYYQNQKPKVNPQTPGAVGTFKGIVLDAKSSEGIAFANVVALNADRAVVAGAVTDLDGRYSLNISTPASYLEISFIGYNKSTVSLSDPSVFSTIRLTEAAESLEEVVVVYEAPKVDRNKSMTVRGSRPEGEVYYVNGVKMRSNVNIPQAAIQSTEMITGGLPAQYGDAIGGVNNTTRRSYGSGSGGSQEFKISQNPVNLKFEVDMPYDVPSDGEEYKVAIAKFEKEVDYLYKAVPKLNEHAFLTASLTDWEGLNLMNGGAGIYLEGTYLGETYLNVEEAGDTLQVSLGKDENIVVQRNSIKQKEGSRLLSGKKEERFHYEIKVRNNKAAALKLEIKDQFPVSGNDDITVTRIENTEGKVDDKSGIVTWEFILQPKEEKKISLIYSIRYPKGKTVNVK